MWKMNKFKEKITIDDLINIHNYVGVGFGTSVHTHTLALFQE